MKLYGYFRSSAAFRLRIALNLKEIAPDAVEVVNLTHISAGEALHIASQMTHLQQQLSIVEDSLNNRIIVGGPRVSRVALVQMLRTLDVPSTQSGGVEVIYTGPTTATAEGQIEIVLPDAPWIAMSSTSSINPRSTFAPVTSPVSKPCSGGITPGSAIVAKM